MQVSWSTNPLPLGRGTRYEAWRGSEALGAAQALALLAGSEVFRDEFDALLAASPHAAFRWETPPLTRSRIDRVFEFVLVNDPFLAMEPEPEVFGGYFRDAPAEVVVLPIPNLGRTATLVVPRGLGDDRVYGHLAAFVRGAPREQVHALWRCVAETAQAALSDRPLWISTAGGGVNWLHVRIEGTPKYYAYRPYAAEA